MKTLLVVLAVAASLPASAAAAQPSSDALLACADITDTAARLTCFDRNAAAARGTPSPPMSSGEPARSQAESSPQPAQAPVPARDVAPPTTVQARIAETRKGAGGRYLVVLDNGQVWSHEMGSMAEFLRVGEAVTIRKSGLSFRLTLDSGKQKNWVRVTQVR